MFNTSQFNTVQFNSSGGVLIESERSIEITGEDSSITEREVEVISNAPYLKKVEQEDLDVKLTWEY